MGTTHIITVGLSVLDTLAGKNKSSLNDSKPFGRAAQKALGQGTITIKASVSHVDDEYVRGCWNPNLENGNLPLQQLRVLVDTIKKEADNPDAQADKSNKHLASAELTGFRLGNGESLELNSEDSIVFLVSDSKEGKAAAFWNAGILLDGKLDDVEWVDLGAGEQFTEQLQPGKTYIVGVPDLHPDRIENFVCNLGNFARQLSESLPSGEGGQVKLHLSGGYKIALPYFLAMGEWILSELNPQNPDDQITAFATHIDRSEHYVRLPLRGIWQYDEYDDRDPNSEFDMIIELAKTKDKVRIDRPDTEYLSGYAYRVYGGDMHKFDAKITMLGIGYAQFLKDRA